MRAEISRLIGAAALASALAGCSADTPALVRFERAQATLHPAADGAAGWVVDGTVDLGVQRAPPPIITARADAASPHLRRAARSRGRLGPG